MEGNARSMLMLKRGPLVAFAERQNKWILVQLRKTDPRMKGGRITEVMQLQPDKVNEGEVYEETAYWAGRP